MPGRRLPSQVEFDRTNPDSQPSCGKVPRSQCFCMILYPDCDLHCKLLAMFERRFSLYHPVYILHDRDVWTQAEFDKYKEEHEGDSPNWVVGEHKKSHYHVMVKLVNQSTTSAFAKFCHLDHVEIVSSIQYYLAYMIHDTPDSWDKFQYSIDDLRGDSKIIRLLDKQNVHFVQLGEIASMVNTGASLVEIRSMIELSDNASSLIETFNRYEHFIVAMSNQYDNRSRRSASDERTLNNMMDQLEARMLVKYGMMSYS